jgi:branched-chain amino acid transport system permease protein
MTTQLIVNALIAGAVYTLVGTGFAMIYWCARFFNFAHASVYTMAAYTVFALTRILSLPFSIAMFAAIVVAAGFGASLELFVYRPLRRRHTSALGLLLASLGIMVTVQNVIALVFGDDVKSIRTSLIRVGYAIGDARITAIQTYLIVSAAILSILLWLVLYRTKTGRSFRAVTNDAELARIVGIDSDRVVLWTFSIGSAFAGVAGILVALDTDLSPTMGTRVLLMAVVAVIIGGEGRILGVVLGGLLVGITQQFGVLKLDTQWQDAIVFVLLIIFLLLRPQGFLGKSQRKVAV